MFLGEMLTWCEPMYRARMEFVKGDIGKALCWFKDKTGEDARFITLHPRNQRFASEVPEGIAIEYAGGCLSWEVWLAPGAILGDKRGGGIAEHPPAIMSTLAGGKFRVDIIHAEVATRELPKRGRKHRELPVDLIEKWQSEGLGSKAIASRLKGEGVVVSYKTIQRLLKGERLLV